MIARAILLQCSADLPARAAIVNMKQFNGICGCLYCESKGFTGHSPLHRFWFYDPSAPLRSNSSILDNAREALNTGDSVCIMLILCNILM